MVLRRAGPPPPPTTTTTMTWIQTKNFNCYCDLTRLPIPPPPPRPPTFGPLCQNGESRTRGCKKPRGGSTDPYYGDRSLLSGHWRSLVLSRSPPSEPPFILSAERRAVNKAKSVPTCERPLHPRRRPLPPRFHSRRSMRQWSSGMTSPTPPPTTTPTGRSS